MEMIIASESNLWRVAIDGFTYEIGLECNMSELLTNEIRGKKYILTQISFGDLCGEKKRLIGLRAVCVVTIRLRHGYAFKRSIVTNSTKISAGRS